MCFVVAVAFFSYELIERRKRKWRWEDASEASFSLRGGETKHFIRLCDNTFISLSFFLSCGRRLMNKQWKDMRAGAKWKRKQSSEISEVDIFWCGFCAPSLLPWNVGLWKWSHYIFGWVFRCGCSNIARTQSHQRLFHITFLSPSSSSISMCWHVPVPCYLLLFYYYTLLTFPMKVKLAPNEIR